MLSSLAGGSCGFIIFCFPFSYVLWREIALSFDSFRFASLYTTITIVSAKDFLITFDVELDIKKNKE